MYVLHLLFPFAVYRTVCSSPVPPNPIKSKVELPLLVLLLSFVSLLFFTKWFYIIRRRQSKRAEGSGTALQSRWHDNFSTSPLRFGKLYMGSDVKSGFLIGLLGSPSWETRYSAVMDDRSPLHDPRPSLSQGSKCSTSCCGSARSPVPGERINRPLSPPPPAVTINRSPLLSDVEYMRFLNGHISAITPLVNSSPNLCTKNGSQPSVPNAPRSSSSVSTRGTIQAGYPHLFGQNGPDLAANKPLPVTPSPTPKPTKHDSRPSSAEQEPQRSLESLFVALSFQNLVSRFESTSTNKYSSSFRSRATPPTKQLLSLPPDRRSPKIGPSPLRTMIFPPDSCPDHFRAFSSNGHDNQVRPPGHCDIGFHPAVNLVLDRAKHVRLSSTLTKSTEADSLLDLMSELAQETRAWDPTVFMNENFKNLIAPEDSKPRSALKGHTLRTGRLSWTSSRQRKFQHAFTTLEDIPEVDVTEMMPAPTGDTYAHSFWSDEEDDRQHLFGNPC